MQSDLPVVSQNSGNPNQIDVQFNKNSRHERVSQSEALRPSTILNLNRLDWLKGGATVLVSCYVGLLSLQIAWMIMPIEPTYHAFLRWTIFFAPIAIIPGWVFWLRASLKNPTINRPSKYLLFAGVGLMLVMFFHHMGG